MPFGYHGKILHIDLSSGKIEIETPPESFYRTYMGGGAMGTYYLLQKMPKGADPLGAESILTVFDSVVTGASISGQSRINVNAKSPMTGGIGDLQAGGFFPAEFKFSGYDGIVFYGQSPNWVYLSILNGEVKLHDANHLVGKMTGEVDGLLRLETGDEKAQVMQIGPAAEAGVRFSGIVNMSNRLNGRTGMGLVMASKKLKAIVVRGKLKPAIADQKALTDLNRAGPVSMTTNPDMSVGALGTAGVVMFQNMLGTLPTRNYSEGQFEHAEAISGEKLAETILKKRDTCFACIVRCKRVVEITDGPYTADPQYGGTEYETIGTFGSYCGIGDLAAISHAHQICDMYGVDSISCGATIAFAMECFEKGIISLADTGGIELKFGNTEAMIAVLMQIVTRTGKLGPILSEGSARAAVVWGHGAEACLITCKNEESPAHMPQVKRSLALIYAVNPFGSDHQSSEHDPYYEEGVAQFNLDRLMEIGLSEPQPARSLTNEKVRFAFLTQCFYSMMDTLTLCQFVYGPTWCLYGPQETAKMVSAVTGWQVTIGELMKLGHRRIALMRAFNAREGFSRKDDMLPAKFFTPLTGKGPSAGVALDHDEINSAIDQYYHLAGLSSEGIPTDKTLQDLDLNWVIESISG